MNFKSPEKVLQTIQAGDDIAKTQGENRTRINDSANGVPPLTVENAQEQNLYVNVNWGEMAVLFSHALQQFTNAFQRTNTFFKVKIPRAPEPRKMEWEQVITNAINRLLKKSRSWFFLQRDVFMSVIPHGLAFRLWKDKENWLSEFIPLADVRIALDTHVSLDNLMWFAILDHNTEGELSEKVFGENSLPGWNKPALKNILKEYHAQNTEDADTTWEQPEKMAELIKQNSGFHSSDAVPTIPLWRFYYQGKNGWYLLVVPHANCRGVPDPSEFLFESKKPAAEKLEHLFQAQIGDLSTTAPAKIHAVRSLGFMLMEPCFWTNLVRCRGLQYLFESFNIWLRCADPADRARALEINLADRTIMPPGVSIVPQNERHQINQQFWTTLMAQFKQLMNEASSSYTQQSDTGTQKEQTAFETSVKLSQVTAMLNGIITVFIFQEQFHYREQCRRLSLRKSSDPDAIKFQRECQRSGIPSEYVNEEHWDIEPEIPMGLGNPTMEMVQSKQMMELRPLMNPQAQQEVLHQAVAVVSGDPRKALHLVPLDQETKVSHATEFAIASFAVLMLGLPVPVKPGLNLPDQITVLLGLMSGLTLRLQQTGTPPLPQEIIGLQTVAQHLQGLIQQFAQDEAQAPLAKKFQTDLKKLMKTVQDLSQEIQPPTNPEAAAATAAIAESQAHIAALQQTTQAKLQTDAAAAQLDHQIKQKSFLADESRQNDAHASNQARLDQAAAAQQKRLDARDESHAD